MSNVIDHIDREAADIISKAALAELKDMCKKWNLHVTWSGTRFNNKNMRMKFEVALISNGEINKKARVDFKDFCYRYDLKVTDLDRQFFYKGNKYKIVGLNTRAHVYPIQTIRVYDGRPFSFAAKLVKSILTKKK